MSHRISLSKFNRFQMRQNMFPDLKETKLEISDRQIIGKFPNSWKPNNTLLNSPWVKEEVSREIKNMLNCIKMKIQHM